MDHEFWHQRWQSNQIGFHMDRPHPLLLDYWDQLGLAAGARVLVPLCGKSPDLLWLAQQGYRVVGVELSDVAIRAFLAENGLEAEQPAPNRFEAGRIELTVGDFLAVEVDEIGPVDAVYDRAALIALPEPMRRDYARHLHELAGPAPGLLITLEYPPGQIDPPPFSVDQAELRSIFGGRCEVLGRMNAEVKGAPAREVAYLLRQPTGDEIR